MAMTWGKTGNVQPGLDVGMSLSAAVWAHIKLKPITKLYFNDSWVQLITISSNICRSCRKCISVHNIEEIFRQYSDLVDVFSPFST